MPEKTALFVDNISVLLSLRWWWCQTTAL